ncbi:hypothetical protein, partial [Aneurinibacillus aneurinilyticus]|uniref:hypothetical protein n=1 Tax=Aneurinibacillus aneurinilyticus TaxID=1391 RepID=UPI003D197AA2
NKINILLIFLSSVKRNTINKYAININCIFEEEWQEEKQATGFSLIYQSVYYFCFHSQSS